MTTVNNENLFSVCDLLIYKSGYMYKLRAVLQLDFFHLTILETTPFHAMHIYLIFFQRMYLGFPSSSLIYLEFYVVSGFLKITE